MLTTLQLEDLFNGLGTPAAGRAIVVKARREAPVREVRSNGGNVITLYPSKKMERVIATESRHVEFPAMFLHEHDPHVLEYYPQPAKRDFILTDGGTKKPYRISHTPDFLVIEPDGIRFEECKEEDWLMKRNRDNPKRWTCENGVWRQPEVEESLAAVGIGYRIRCATEFPREYIENLTFLSSYMQSSADEVPPEVLAFMKGLFENHASWSMAELLDMAKALPEVSGPRPPFTVDHLYKAIADRSLTFDLMNDLVSDFSRVSVYRDQPTMEFARRTRQDLDILPMNRLDVSIGLGTKIEFEGTGYVVRLIGNPDVRMEDEQGQFTEMTMDNLRDLHKTGRVVIRPAEPVAVVPDQTLDALSPSEIRRVLERAEWLELAHRSPGLVPRSERTIQRYRQAMRKAGVSAFDQNFALASSYRDSGNWGKDGTRLSDEMVALIKEVTKRHYNHPRELNKHATYKLFHVFCLERQWEPCSEKTFLKILNRHTNTRARSGKRVAYQTSPIVGYLYAKEPIHGVRPFQIVHIDHTQLEILARAPGSKLEPDRPWLTLAIDAESRMILGFYLTFDPPSYRSDMMALRDIVRRHGRFPEMIVTDNGADYHSEGMKRLCALNGCSLRYRPAGRARYGTIVERAFGIIHSEFVHCLMGNTQVMKRARQATKSVLPENFQVWSLPALHGGLDSYFSEVYGMEVHPAHQERPVLHFKEQMALTGERKNRLVKFDEGFLVESCPGPKTGGDTRVVDGERGVLIDHVYYTCKGLWDNRLKGKKVQVRVEPWDFRHVYVLIQNKWHIAICNSYHRLRGYTRTEALYARQEFLQRRKPTGDSTEQTRLLEWYRLLDPRNFDPRLAEQQDETRMIYEPLGMTMAMKAGDIGSGVPKVAAPTPGPSPSSAENKEHKDKPATSSCISLPPPAKAEPSLFIRKLLKQSKATKPESSWGSPDDFRAF